MTETDLKTLKAIRDAWSLAEDANDWQQKHCECDPESNQAPCRMCAIRDALKHIPWLCDQLEAQQQLNGRIHGELLKEKEQVSYMERMHESAKAVSQGVWKEHEQQFEQQAKEIGSLKQQLESAQKERDQREQTLVNLYAKTIREAIDAALKPESP